MSTLYFIQPVALKAVTVGESTSYHSLYDDFHTDIPTFGFTYTANVGNGPEPIPINIDNNLDSFFPLPDNVEPFATNVNRLTQITSDGSRLKSGVEEGQLLDNTNITVLGKPVRMIPGSNPINFLGPDPDPVSVTNTYDISAILTDEEESIRNVVILSSDSVLDHMLLYRDASIEGPPIYIPLIPKISTLRENGLSTSNVYVYGLPGELASASFALIPNGFNLLLSSGAAVINDSPTTPEGFVILQTSETKEDPNIAVTEAHNIPLIEMVPALNRGSTRSFAETTLNYSPSTAHAILTPIIMEHNSTSLTLGQLVQFEDLPLSDNFPSDNDFNDFKMIVSTNLGTDLDTPISLMWALNQEDISLTYGD